MQYKTKGVCASEINFDVDDNKIKNVKFTKGCNGNLNGISSLVDGMNVDDVIEKLNGTDCGGRGTSCPDQLAKALMEYKKNA